LRPTDKAWVAWKADPSDENLKYLSDVLYAHAASVCWTLNGKIVPDVIAQASQQCLLKLNTFNGGSEFSTWAHRVMTNVFLLAHRRRQRKREVPLDNLTDAETAVSRVGAIEAKLLLEDLSDPLGVDEKALLDGKLNGVEQAELAAELGITESNLRLRWMRLRAKLQEALK
jgi:RNA polymerase sigma factor (sigma-70 family)